MLGAALLLAIFSGLTGYNVVNGLQTGRIFGQWGYVRRADRPFWFWQFVIGHGIFSVVMLLGCFALVTGLIAER